MATLTAANRELYRRGPDETFSSLAELHDHCRQEPILFGTRFAPSLVSKFLLPG